jgi:hypothetical protein
MANRLVCSKPPNTCPDTGGPCDACVCEACGGKGWDWFDPEGWPEACQFCAAKEKEHV